MYPILLQNLPSEGVRLIIYILDFEAYIESIREEHPPSCVKRCLKPQKIKREKKKSPTIHFDNFLYIYIMQNFYYQQGESEEV